MRTDEDKVKETAEFCRDWEYLNVASELAKTYVVEWVVLNDKLGNPLLSLFLLLVNVLLLGMFSRNLRPKN